MHSIRTFAKIPRTVSKRCRAASPTAAPTGASSASRLPLTAPCSVSTWSSGGLLPGGGLTRTALALLACSEMSCQEKERRHANRQQCCGDGL
jgi:hypothetical protein